jgi:hypothetical protein
MARGCKEATARQVAHELTETDPVRAARLGALVGLAACAGGQEGCAPAALPAGAPASACARQGSAGSSRQRRQQQAGRQRRRQQADKQGHRPAARLPRLAAAGPCPRPRRAQPGHRQHGQPAAGQCCAGRRCCAWTSFVATGPWAAARTRCGRWTTPPPQHTQTPPILQASFASGVAFTVGAGIPLAAGGRRRWAAAAAARPECACSGSSSGSSSPSAPPPLLQRTPLACRVSIASPDPAAAGAAVQHQPGRIISVAIVTTVALVLLGAVSAYLGGAKRLRAAVRVLLGGWLAMGEPAAPLASPLTVSQQPPSCSRCCRAQRQRQRQHATAPAAGLVPCRPPRHPDAPSPAGLTFGIGKAFGGHIMA